MQDKRLFRQVADSLNVNSLRLCVLDITIAIPSF